MNFEVIVEYLSNNKILNKINNEIKTVNKDRKCSATIIEIIKKFIEETKFKELVSKNLNSHDLDLLYYLIITHLHCLNKEKLLKLQRIILAAHNPKFSKPDSFFSKILRSHQFKQLKLIDQNLTSKYMRSPQNLKFLDKTQNLCKL